MLSCFAAACRLRAPDYGGRPLIIEENVRTIGTRQYWQHRSNALYMSVLELLEETGMYLPNHVNTCSTLIPCF